MSEESLLIVCPNPNCRKEIEKPILLTILSITPNEQYEACPYCFSKLEKTPIEKKVTQRPEGKQKTVQSSTIEQEEKMRSEAKEEIIELKSKKLVLKEKKDSSSDFFKRIKALIPGTTRDRKKQTDNSKMKSTDKNVLEQNKERQITNKDKEEQNNEARQIEAIRTEKIKEPKSEELSNACAQEVGLSGCPETFGYLANRQKEKPVPQYCLTCAKMVDCMLSPRDV